MEEGCIVCGGRATRRLGVPVRHLDGEFEEVPVCEKCLYRYDVKYDAKRNRYEFKPRRPVRWFIKWLLVWGVESARLGRAVERLAPVAGAFFASRFVSAAALAAMGIGLYLLVNWLVFPIANPRAFDMARAFYGRHPLHGVIGVPGIDPLMPLYVWPAFFITVFVHELAHGLAAARTGSGEVRAIGVAFLGPLPAAGYADVNPRFFRSRGAFPTLAAGLGSNILLSAACIAILAAHAFYAGLKITPLMLFPPELLSAFGVRIASKLSFISWLAFFNLLIGAINALPLPSLDGYYMLAKILEYFGVRRPFRAAKIAGYAIIALVVFLVLRDRI